MGFCHSRCYTVNLLFLCTSELSLTTDHPPHIPDNTTVSIKCLMEFQVWRLSLAEYSLVYDSKRGQNLSEILEGPRVGTDRDRLVATALWAKGETGHKTTLI